MSEEIVEVELDEALIRNAADDINGTKMHVPIYIRIRPTDFHCSCRWTAKRGSCPWTAENRFRLL
jgi:hypothetical protein